MVFFFIVVILYGMTRKMQKIEFIKVTERKQILNK